MVKKLLLCFIGFLMLTSCGQTGPLYLPSAQDQTKNDTP